MGVPAPSMIVTFGVGGRCSFRRIQCERSVAGLLMNWPPTARMNTTPEVLPLGLRSRVMRALFSIVMFSEAILAAISFCFGGQCGIPGATLRGLLNRPFLRPMRCPPVQLLQLRELSEHARGRRGGRMALLEVGHQRGLALGGLPARARDLLGLLVGLGRRLGIDEPCVEVIRHAGGLPSAAPWYDTVPLARMVSAAHSAASRSRSALNRSPAQ